MSKYKATDDMLNEYCADLAASQAREAKLREAVILCKYAAGHPEKVYGITKNALALPTDDTALKEAIKQGKREILLKAATEFDSRGEFQGHGESLRKMADEL
jgi:hypothetical protein